MIQKTDVIGSPGIQESMAYRNRTEKKLQGDLSYKFAKVAFPFPRQPHMGKNLIMRGWGGIWLLPITFSSIFVPNIGMKHE